MNKQLLTTLENSKNYTLAVAALMPEKDYAFKPAGAGWNFGETLDHIAYGIGWWEENFIKGNKIDWNPPAAATSRKAIIANLEKAYASLEKTIKNQKEDETTVQGFHATLDHITHHRGQAVVFLRCKGITPPDYTY